jgi:hypothetical protein
VIDDLAPSLVKVVDTEGVRVGVLGGEALDVVKAVALNRSPWLLRPSVMAEQVMDYPSRPRLIDLVRCLLAALPR